ncbi:ATP-binding protein [Azospirillum isscasi]|uniref:ATP-binding protein n=1 Tax=Azospirillum isscasi TaxID=3053926 RepID=A0ABU0WNR8_9PROT|nr:ATP-binding protein [Azospirillum isscasi]MDQ2105886.1 ATP-binding protein [Azospirillum isscasi]
MVPSPTHVAALHGLGVPPDRLERLSAALGLPFWRPGSPAGEGFGPSVLLLVGDVDAVEAPDFWRRPFGAWIEVAGLSDAQVVEAARRAVRADLFACVTTVAANRLHLAGRILNGLAALHPMPETQRDDMELALHEAISNAVVHGNLQVEGMKGLSVEALERFSHDLAARMADPAFAGRRIEVAAWLESAAAVVEVADEGTGFDRPERIDYGASGRGLDLIAAIVEELQLLDGGRRIRMRFPL